MRAHNRREFDLANTRLEKLEEAINKEIEDRVTESDELIYQTRDDLQDLQSQFDEECQTQKDREKDILQALDDEKYKLNKKIDAERTDKSLTLGKFRDQTNKQLKMQHKYVEEFQKNAMIEFQKLRETLENEMDDRFVSQDEIIDNLSNSIKTFQDTMKIIGQTVI